MKKVTTTESQRYTARNVIAQRLLAQQLDPLCVYGLSTTLYQNTCSRLLLPELSALITLIRGTMHNALMRLQF